MGTTIQLGYRQIDGWKLWPVEHGGAWWSMEIGGTDFLCRIELTRKETLPNESLSISFGLT